MSNLNVSRNMAQALSGQEAQQLVNKILEDKGSGRVVDKTDKEDLKKLETLLETAAKKDDATVDGDEKELIGALTDHSYTLGVNLGTSESILLANLQRIQDFQARVNTLTSENALNPAELSFEGMAITTDGFLSDDIMVMRLKDYQAETPIDAPAETATGEVATTQLPREQVNYTPSSSPIAGTVSPASLPDSSANAKVEPQRQAYVQAATELQAEVSNIRTLLNDPAQTSNAQLQKGLETFAQKDPGKALVELQKYSPAILGDMVKQRLISSADANLIQSLSSSETGRTKLSSQELSNKKQFDAVFSDYLAKNPLSDSQLNKYRSNLVKTADAYIANPGSKSNLDQVKSQLYSNLYAFESNVTPAQETAYRKLSPALDKLSQKEALFTQQSDIVSGKKSLLNPTDGSVIKTAKDLANQLNDVNSKPQQRIKTLSAKLDDVLKYLKENPAQYEGQDRDVISLESKLNELKSSTNTERQATLLNELKTDLDEVYVKTGIGKGSEGVSQTDVVDQLMQLKSTATPEEQKAIDFLIKYPELIQKAPQISDYKQILASLSGPQILSDKEQQLKTALETGDVSQVNNLYSQEFFGSLSLFNYPSFGSALSLSQPSFSLKQDLSLGSLTKSIDSDISSSIGTSSLFKDSLGLNKKTSLDSFNLNVNEPLKYSPIEPQKMLPGTWTNSSNLAEIISKATPERAKELMAALNSSDAELLQSALKTNPQLSQLAGKFETAQLAKQSIESAHWNNNSTLDSAQEDFSTQTAMNTGVPAELENAQAALDKLLNNPDVAGPVKEKLEVQKKALDIALERIKAGTFTDEFASSPEMAGLDTLLTNLASDKSLPRMSSEVVLQREATIAVLNDMKSDPSAAEAMSQLQKAVGDLKDENGKLRFEGVFNGTGENDFYTQMETLLKDNTLSPDALKLMNYQVNRSIDLIETARPEHKRSIDTLKANFLSGQDQAKTSGVERDFYSGYMAMQNIATINRAAKDSGYLSNVDVLNSLGSLGSGMNEIESNSSLNYQEKRAQISKLLQDGMSGKEFTSRVDEAKKAAATGISAEQLTNVVQGVDRILQANDSSPKAMQEAKTLLQEELRKIDPSLVDSVLRGEDLYKKLTPEQIQALGAAIQTMPLPPEEAAREDARDKAVDQLAALRITYDPGMSTQGLSNQAVTLINQIRAIDQVDKNTSPQALLKNAFGVGQNVAGAQRTSLADTLQRMNQTTAEFVNQTKSELANSMTLLNTTVDQVPGLQSYIDNYMADFTKVIKDKEGNPLTLDPPFKNPPDIQSSTYYRDLGILNDGMANAIKQFTTTDAYSNLSSKQQGLVLGANSLATSNFAMAPVVFAMATGQPVSEDAMKGAVGASAYTTLTTSFLKNINNTEKSESDLAKLIDDYKVDFGVVTVAVNTSDFSPSASDSQEVLHVKNEAQNVKSSIIAASNNAVDMLAAGLRPYVDPVFANVSPEELNIFAPPPPVGGNSITETVINNFSFIAEKTTEGTPAQIRERASSMVPIMQAQSKTWSTFVESAQQFTQEMNQIRQEAGMPPINTTRLGATSAPIDSKGLTPDQKAADLVAKANELSDRLVLAPKGADSEEFLNELVTDFINIIRDQDYKTRQLVLAQLANQMMTDSITNFYKDKTDKNNKYHQDSLARMASSFEQNIQKSIQSSLVASASGSDAQSVAAVSGQVGAAGTAQAMSVAQLRSSTEELLSQAQQLEPPLITNQQKDQILNSLFDDNPNNDALGIIALAGLQPIH